MKPKLKEHIYRELVNELTETSRYYAGTQHYAGGYLRLLTATLMPDVIARVKSRWMMPSSAVRLIGQLVTQG